MDYGLSFYTIIHNPTFTIQYPKKTYCLTTPQFAPNMYDLISMLMADEVIWLDEAGWSRKGRSHRSRITNGEESVWIRVPVLSEDRSKAINKVRIDQRKKWTKIMLKKIESMYSRHTFYDYFEAELSALIQDGRDFELLIDWNSYFFDQILSFMELTLALKLQSLEA